MERELEKLQQKLAGHEDKSNKMYLHMYAKEHDQQQPGPSTSSSTPSRISVPELMHQLQVTQDELENIRVSWKFSMQFFYLVKFLCFTVNIFFVVNENWMWK